MFALSQEVAIYDGAIVEFFQTINMQSNHLEMVKPTNYALESTYSNGVQVNNNVEGQCAKSVVKLQTRSGLSADDVTISELKNYCKFYRSPYRNTIVIFP